MTLRDWPIARAIVVVALTFGSMPLACSTSVSEDSAADATADAAPSTCGQLVLSLTGADSLSADLVACLCENCESEVRACAATGNACGICTASDPPSCTDETTALNECGATACTSFAAPDASAMTDS